MFLNVPMSEYRAASGVSQGNLKEIAISPAHYRAAVTTPEEEPTQAQKIGQVIHSVLLDHTFSQFVIRPDTYPATVKGKKGMPDITVNKKWSGTANYCKEWMEQQEVTVITTTDWTDIRGMIASIQSHPKASRILNGEGNNEVSIWKRHEPTGLLLKGRADRVTTDNNDFICIPDLKSCQRGGAAQDEFSRSIYNYGYERQAAYYLDLFGATFFIFIAVEKEAPYAVACYNLSPDSIALGRRQNERDLAIVNRCTETGVWPAYPEGLYTIGVPDWVLKRE